MEFFGLTADLTPAVRLINVENMEKFKYDGAIDAAGLVAFLNTFKAGGVKVSDACGPGGCADTGRRSISRARTHRRTGTPSRPRC